MLQNEMTRDPELLREMDEGEPFGVLTFESLQRPAVTYMNPRMRQLLTEETDNSFNVREIEDNVIFLFSYSGRQLLRSSMEAARATGAPAMFEDDISGSGRTGMTLRCWVSYFNTRSAGSFYRISCLRQDPEKRALEISRREGVLSAIMNLCSLAVLIDKKTGLVRIMRDRSGLFLDADREWQNAVWFWPEENGISGAVERYAAREDRRALEELLVKYIIHYEDVDAGTAESMSFSAELPGIGKTKCESCFLSIDEKQSLFCVSRAGSRAEQPKAAAKTEETAEKPGRPAVFLRTFGYFDVYVNDRPIAFTHEKSKEMLAVLTDRRGGFVSSSEMVSYLWEDESFNKTTQSRCRQVASRLKKILDENGIGDIIETVNGQRRIVPERVDCDYFRFLDHEPGYERMFKGLYMQNYSWSEMTSAELGKTLEEA